MKICEIFHSIQGESTYAGLPCVFIRTSGCNLRCSYCDTVYAYEGGTDMSFDEIISSIKPYGCGLIELTGGEPMMQMEEANMLMNELLDNGYKVLLETNGSLSLESIDKRVVKIMDIKCPDSGMMDHIRWENIEHLTENDQAKFVLSSHKDYEWAKHTKDCVPGGIEVLFSVAFGTLSPAEVASWILMDRLKVRFQLQLHKYIWHPNMRGV